MANPLLNLFGNGSPQPQQPNMFQRFQEFANNFRGDPRQKVQEMLQNGTMTQEQFNQYSNIANQLTHRR
jgi:hypothetical protein